ncbi:MAG: hypothetical protein CMI54_05965 [Parcubacteria group bacterium]|nr:hypothetical protein [Parcubacteria group bacterium]|tara:strand:+ start:25126 stop:25410 length:285 start_codon:yes stop_codon:yes gene_type:complete
MTKKRTLKQIENLATALNKEKGYEDAASIMYVLAGTIALDNEEALHSLCVHNVLWADQILKAIQSSGEDKGTPQPKIILPGDESDGWADDGGQV